MSYPSRRSSPLGPEAAHHLASSNGENVTARRQGYTLIITLGAIVLLTLAALSVSRNAAMRLRSVSLGLYEKQAVRAAEAGLADAVVALRADAAWGGFVPVRRTLPSFPELSYQVAVTNNVTGSAPVTATDGTVVPVAAVYLCATGFGPGGVRRTVSALATRQDDRLFRNALFGDKSITTSGGTLIDAWDSSLGPYGPSTIIANAADVATNGTTAGVLSFGGGTSINGDLYIGANADPTVAVVGADSASGTVNVFPTVVPLTAPTPSSTPPPPYSNVKVTNGQTRTLAPGTYGDVTVSGGTLVLQSGTYVFAAAKSSTGSILVKGGGIVEVAPGATNVRVFFSGSWDSQGGAIINPTGKAANLVFIGAPTVASVTLVGGTDATYGFYASTADIKITGGSDINGGLVGASIKITSNTNIHFDAGLLDLQDVRGISSWALTAHHRG